MCVSALETIEICMCQVYTRKLQADKLYNTQISNARWLMCDVLELLRFFRSIRDKNKTSNGNQIALKTDRFPGKI